MCTRYMMLIPRVMKGLEKSMTFSLSAVMVRPATAKSAFCNTCKIIAAVRAFLGQKCAKKLSYKQIKVVHTWFLAGSGSL